MSTPSFRTVFVHDSIDTKTEGTMIDLITGLDRQSTLKIVKQAEKFLILTLLALLLSSCGSSTSAPAPQAIVDQPPSITVQPISQTVTIGNPVTFSVLATGTSPFTYQWRKDSIDIVNAISSTLTIDSTIPLDVGKYDVVVTNVLASVTSAPASLLLPTTSQLYIQAWNPDGSPANFEDFVNFTHYKNSDWESYQNYGIFPMGQLPGTHQIGSDISHINVDGVEYIAMEVASQAPYYFTALWEAPLIGTVFMRADNEGAGYLSDSNNPQKLELPYDFARGEFQQAQRLLPSTALSPDAQALLSQATATMDLATNATDASSRAIEAYSALSSIMLLKERLVLDASNALIAAARTRSDFDLNYEGFGSWTDEAFVPGYMAAKDAGFQSVYTNIDWKRTSPAQGVYELSWLDSDIDRAEQLGFKVALSINGHAGFFAEWMKDLNFNELKSVFYENAYTVVSRYGSRVSVYYPSAELELGTQHFTMGQIAELAEQSLYGARAADPDLHYGMYVSASAYVSYVMNAIDKPDYFSSLDLVSYLSQSDIDYDFLGLQMQYGTIFAPIDLQRFQEILQHFYHAANIPIYMGETGYSSKTEDYGIPGPFYWHDGLTQQAQYEWADGTLRILYAMPFVLGYYWVHLDPDDYDYGDQGNSALLGTGLLRADGMIKKVHTAFKTFTSQLQM